MGIEDAGGGARPRWNEEQPGAVDQPPAEESPENLKTAGDTGKSVEQKTGKSVEQKTPSTSDSPLRDHPSYGGFDNLDDEFKARAHSREVVKASNEPVESPGPVLNDKAIRRRIDPHAPDITAAEGHKETPPTVNGENAAGVNSDDLPTGEELADTDEDKPRIDRFRKAVINNYDKLDERASKLTNAIDKAFGPRPTGQAESRVDGGPVVVDAQHPSMDVGTAAAAVLAASIFSVEAFHWARKKMKEKGNE